MAQNRLAYWLVIYLKMPYIQLFYNYSLNPAISNLIFIKVHSYYYKTANFALHKKSPTVKKSKTA